MFRATSELVYVLQWWNLRDDDDDDDDYDDDDDDDIDDGGNDDDDRYDKFTWKWADKMMKVNAEHLQNLR